MIMLFICAVVQMGNKIIACKIFKRLNFRGSSGNYDTMLLP